jgi:hypothetical protein
MHKIKTRCKADDCKDNANYALGINAFCQAKAYQYHKADNKQALENWSVDHKLGFEVINGGLRYGMNPHKYSTKNLKKNSPGEELPRG